MNPQDIIQYLKLSMNNQDPEISAVDEDYLALTDEQILMTLQVGLSKVDSEQTISDMSEECLYPTLIMAKIEIFHMLAVKSAYKYDLASATGVQLKREQVFQHYMAMIKQLNEEYDKYLSTGGINGGIGGNIKTGEILLDNRYYSPRNYSLTDIPKLNIYVDNLYSNKVELSWKIRKINKFYKVEIYISKDPIVDLYSTLSNQISSSAKKVFETQDVHLFRTRIGDLEPNTEYYVCAVAYERNLLKGYSETKILTKEVI